MNGAHPLDNPALAALRGPHAYLAERCGQALRYPADVAPFVGLPDEPDLDAWKDLAGLVGPAGVAASAAVLVVPPPGWDTLMSIDAVQMVDDHVDAADDSDAIELGPADVPEMMDLVARTRPGPFRPRTVELGGYLGVRRDGALVAMAGQRLRLPGWTEISGVCTDPAFRGQGLATRLTLAVAADIRARDDVPFLHASADNTDAIRLYESVGFALRRAATFVVMRAPAAPSPS